MTAWSGRVTDVEGDTFTAWLVPSDHEGPELCADFSMERCGIEVQEGDLLTVTPESVVKVDPGVWTQEEIDEIGRRAAERYRLLMENVE